LWNSGAFTRWIAAASAARSAGSARMLAAALATVSSTTPRRSAS
jgi:hypothetical protein